MGSCPVVQLGHRAAQLRQFGRGRNTDHDKRAEKLRNRRWGFVAAQRARSARPWYTWTACTDAGGCRRETGAEYRDQGFHRRRQGGSRVATGASLRRQWRGPRRGLHPGLFHATFRGKYLREHHLQVGKPIWHVLSTVTDWSVNSKDKSKSIDISYIVIYSWSYKLSGFNSF